MNQNFFANTATQKNIAKCIDTVRQLIPTDNFTTERNSLLIHALTLFQKDTTQWDECTQFNIENIGNVFLKELSSDNTSFENLNLIYSSCFRFIMEAEMFTDSESRVSASVKDFAIYRADEFDKQSRTQIFYALRDMPIKIFKQFIYTEDVKTYRDFARLINDARNFETNWNKTLEAREKRVSDLNDSLSRNESAFNFVGLYDGFFRLGQLKNSELNWAKWVMIALGVFLPIPLIGEMLYILTTDNNISDLNHLIKSIPIISITLILIYYFRIALSNYNSIRAQLMQIELRKSLCCFIQSYAEYAKEMKANNEGILTKFEEIIFSNIMPTQEQMPSTFDGIEQLANLVGSFKGNKQK